jgi:hypothetical protein
MNQIFEFASVHRILHTILLGYAHYMVIYLSKSIYQITITSDYVIYLMWTRILFSFNVYMSTLQEMRPHFRNVLTGIAGKGGCVMWGGPGCPRWCPASLGPSSAFSSSRLFKHAALGFRFRSTEKKWQNSDLVHLTSYHWEESCYILTFKLKSIQLYNVSNVHKHITYIMFWHKFNIVFQNQLR